MRFLTRALCSLPLMAVVGFCMFGFIDTFEPMPRLQQFAWRGVYVVAGVTAFAAIVWMWLWPLSFRMGYRESLGREISE